MKIVRGFEEKMGFFAMFGAIDGSHIPIITPTHSPTNCYNRKGFHYIVLQVLVDHLYRLLMLIEVYQKGESGTLVPSHIRTLSGVPVPEVGLLVYCCCCVLHLTQHL